MSVTAEQEKDLAARLLMVEHEVKGLREIVADLNGTLHEHTGALRVFTETQTRYIEHSKAVEERLAVVEREHQPCREMVIANNQRTIGLEEGQKRLEESLTLERQLRISQDESLSARTLWMIGVWVVSTGSIIGFIIHLATNFKGGAH